MVFLLTSWFCVCFFFFLSFQVRICGKQPNHGVGQKQQELPRFMRFNGEQLTVPVVKASCDKGWHWISGTLTASLFKVISVKFLAGGCGKNLMHCYMLSTKVGIRLSLIKLMRVSSSDCFNVLLSLVLANYDLSRCVIPS